ncbi:sensor histidine kinase [Neptuniibacter caesariensis]|uniref:histidine kinase n=1 Tax=Neptuniibacter caesariensis TaxID=207954 RepID=A0A7U8C4E3_NEPCE|nr:ATP-binding protein [Neptuniibacter caesariensis]EAR61004.1 PAS protein [Neptuniibacter caesariensis]
MSLRLKTIIGIAAIEAVLLLLLVSMTLDYLRTTNYEGIVKRASTTATLFATTAKDAVLSYDLASLDAFVNEVLKNPDLVYARVLGPDQQLFAEAGMPEALSADFAADQEVESVDDGIFDTYALVAEGGVVYGRVELGLDINLLRQTIAEAEQRSALIAAMEMGLVALFSFILGTYLTRQLQGLRKGAQQISAGELDINIPVKGKDEIADVARAFNVMASDLEEASRRRDQYEAELEELNRSLEDRVKQRTHQLVEKNKELLQANDEIKKTQAKLVQSEKMASVGVLAAGVAHEINNPLGFVMSNLCTLEEYVKNYRELLGAYETLFSLKDSQERKAQYAKIKSLVEEYDLAFMNDDLDDLLKDTHEGSVRVKEIVKGLKAFSHVDSTEEMQLTDLNECIETTLKVANNEIKYHCEIITDLGDIPQINCIPGQIKQVLLNMLLNAAHAIKEQGRIEIASVFREEAVEISIRDNGCGIVKDELGRLFEPFFTTKEVGKGTGLGLSISYGIIVDDHHGDIRVESELGMGSCFTIVLPINKSEVVQEAG